MSDHDLDAVAELAIEELASRLAAPLDFAIDAAASRSLQRVASEIESRADQVETATKRVAEILTSIGDEMRTQAAHALDEVLRSHVGPRLERQTQAVGAVIDERLASAVKNIETVLSIEGKALSDAASALSAAMRDQFAALEESLAGSAKVLRNDIVSAAKEIAASNGEQATETNQRIGKVAEALQRQVHELGTATIAALVKLSQTAEGDAKSLSQNLSQTEERLTRAAKETEQSILNSLSMNTAQVVSRLNNLTELLTKVRDETSRQRESIRLQLESKLIAHDELLTRSQSATEARLKLLRYVDIAIIGLLLILLFAGPCHH